MFYNTRDEALASPKEPGMIRRIEPSPYGKGFVVTQVPVDLVVEELLMPTVPQHVVGGQRRGYER